MGLRKWLNGLSILNDKGQEVPDPRPMDIPIGFEKPESIQQMIRRFVTDPALRAELDSRGGETFDEADDFDIEDDFPQSPHEEHFDPLHLLSREQEIASGTVLPRSSEEVAHAVKVLSDHKAALAAAKAAKDAAKADVGKVA